MRGRLTRHVSDDNEYLGEKFDRQAVNEWRVGPFEQDHGILHCRVNSTTDSQRRTMTFKKD